MQIFKNNFVLLLYSLYSDINRAIISRGFIVGLVGMVLMIAFASTSQIVEIIRTTEPLEEGFYVHFMYNALHSYAFTLALPILVTLPFTTAFVDDIKSGFIKQYLLRSTRLRYILGKLVSILISGGLLVLIGILISFVVAIIFISPREEVFTGDSVNRIDVIEKAFMISLSGMFWSLVGFAFSSFTMNRYMAYASPFILYYVLIILHERYFPTFYIMYPREWIFPENDWRLGNLGIVILLAMLILVVSLCFALFAKRRLKNV